MLKKLINTLEKFLPEEEKAIKKEIKIEETITVTKIAKHFETSTIIINKSLEIIKYAKKENKWWIVTNDGIEAGGVQKYNPKTKQKYIVWKEKILKDEELIETIQKLDNKNDIEKYTKYSKEWSEAKKRKEEHIRNPKKILNEPIKKRTTHKEKIKKGKEYEEYVAKVYRSRGYHVTEYGKKMGKEDHGIDLIAKKKKHIVLIQCKNWNKDGKWKITHKEIKIFQTEARLFVEDKPLLRNCLLNARYTISGDFIHNSAIKYLEEMQKIGKRVDYEIIEMPI